MVNGSDNDFFRDIRSLSLELGRCFAHATLYICIYIFILPGCTGTKKYPLH